MIVSPKSIITAYPDNNLTDYIKKRSFKKLKFYVDLKNVAIGLFVEEILQKMIDNTEEKQSIDTSYFQSLLYYCAYLRFFGIKHNLPTDIYICTDSGDSCYHNHYNKLYKYKRKITSTIMPEFHDLINEIKLKNISVAEKILNKIPHVYFFYLRFLESDFLPHYLIKEKFKEIDDETTLHIICSSDKDMYQTLNNNNIIQLFRHKNKDIVILNSDNCLENYIKIEKTDKLNSKLQELEKIKLLKKEFIPFLMGLVGDTSDDIRGIPKIGPKKALNLASKTQEVEKLFGSFSEILKKLDNDEDIIKEDVNDLLLNEMDKDWKLVIEAEKQNKTLSNAIRQISYDALIDWMTKKNATKKIEFVNYIDSIIANKTNIESSEKLYNGLTKSFPEFILEEKQLKTFYWEDFT